MPATVVLIKADTAVEGTDGVIRTHEVLVGAPQAARRHRRQRHHPGRGAVRLHGAADDPGHRIERRQSRETIQFRPGVEFRARIQFRPRIEFGAGNEFSTGIELRPRAEFRPREQFSTGIELRPRTELRYP